MAEKQAYILGMDIGGTNFRMGLVDSELKAENIKVYASKDIYEKGDTVMNFAGCIKKYIENCQKEGKEVAAVSIGCPSVVDRERRTLLSSTNFPGLDGVDLVAVLEDQLECRVFIEHDAYYLLAYDIMDFGMDNTGTMIGCYFGTGLGNAMYIDGKEYIGKNGTACELGHLPIPFNEYPCSCGNKGCIEMFSCGKALERIAAEHYRDCHIGDLFKEHREDKILKDFVEYMAAAVAAEANILDPDCIFIGGGIVQMEQFPKEYLEERIKAHCRKPYPASNLKLCFSRPSPVNGIIGAAIRANLKLFN